MSIVVARVYIIRHGETDANRQGIVQGQLDTPLNDAGVEQARLTADALEDTPFEVAYSSDLQRARRVRGSGSWVLMLVLSTECVRNGRPQKSSWRNIRA